MLIFRYFTGRFTFFFDHNIEQNMFLFIKKQLLGGLLQNSCSKSVLSELNYACERDPFNSLLVFSEAAIQRCSKEKVFWKYASNLQEKTHGEVLFQ